MKCSDICKHNFFSIPELEPVPQEPHIVVMCANCGERRILSYNGEILRHNGSEWETFNPKTQPITTP